MLVEDTGVIWIQIGTCIWWWLWKIIYISRKKSGPRIEPCTPYFNVPASEKTSIQNKNLLFERYLITDVLKPKYFIFSRETPWSKHSSKGFQAPPPFLRHSSLDPACFSPFLNFLCPLPFLLFHPLLRYFRESPPP